MSKRPKIITVLTIFGILIGLYNILPVISGGYVFLIIGLITIFLSFGIFMLWNLVRILAFVFSFLFICMYIFLIVLAVMRAYQGFAAITAMFHFPLLIFCLLLIYNLRRKEIKAYFR